jgi:tRNA(Ile)-lysidine synthase
MSLTPENFAAAMQGLLSPANSMQGLMPSASSVAVAVSGGGDSMALAVLLQEWAKANNCKLTAFTVDHGLRAGSGDEALAVQKTLSARGIPHEILKWEGDKPRTHIQEDARAARYRLLCEACRRSNIPVLAVAHNLEDQVETFWMRLAHGSGLDGLAAMAQSRAEDGITIIRPLLDVPREELRSYCKGQRVEWIEDPSNANEKFLRVKLRRFEALLGEEGLTPQRLTQVLQKLGDARDALQSVAATYFKTLATVHPEGYVSLKTAEWKNLPVDLQRRLLSLCFAPLSRGGYAAGFDAVEDLRLALLESEFTGRTLVSCEIFVSKNETVFCREYAAVEGRRPLADNLIWDGRFRVSGYPPDSAMIGAVGEEGLAQLRKSLPADNPLLKRLEGLPFKIKRTLPALWKGNNILALPSLSWISADAEAFSGGNCVFPDPVNIV